jgi:hypothetical protein
MRTKRLYQFVSLALIGLPLLVLVAYQERLPDRLPLHFDEFGQTDQLVPRQQWINKIISSTLLLNFLRIVFMSLLSRQPKLGQPQLMKLHLSTAVLTAGAGCWPVGQGIYQKPLYQEWLPILFFLFGSSFVYYGVPPVLPVPPLTVAKNTLPTARQLLVRQQIHALTRLVTIRVNLLAVLVMVFVRGQDRWPVGFMANLLVYVFMAVYSVYSRRHVDGQ